MIAATKPFQSLKGILSDLDHNCFCQSSPRIDVSIPKRDFIGFRLSVTKIALQQRGVSIPKRDFIGFRQFFFQYYHFDTAVVSIPKRDFIGFRLKLSSLFSYQY